MPYSDWLPRLVPPWLQGQWGGGLIEALAEECDELMDELVQARVAAMPERAASGSATDALVEIGEERQLERGPTETDEDYATRLRAAWDTWLRAGSHPALHQQLQALGFDIANMFIVQRSGRRTELSGGGALVVTNGAIWTLSAKPPEAYAEFGIFFTTSQPGLTWSAGAGFSTDAAKLNRIVKRWRPAKADFLGTHIINSGAVWGWNMTWGSFIWGGSTVFIPPE